MAVFPESNKKKFTNDLFSRDKIEIRRLSLNGELHDSGIEVLHVDILDDLVVIWVICGTHIDEFPFEVSFERFEHLEGDVEDEDRVD